MTRQIAYWYVDIFECAFLNPQTHYIYIYIYIYMYVYTHKHIIIHAPVWWCKYLCILMCMCWYECMCGMWPNIFSLVFNQVSLSQYGWLMPSTPLLDLLIYEFIILIVLYKEMHLLSAFSFEELRYNNSRGNSFKEISLHKETLKHLHKAVDNF